MLSLLRAVARTPAYRRRAPHLRGRAPDDVWLDGEQRWHLAFSLQTSPAEEVILFSISLDDRGEPHVRNAVEVAHEDDHVWIRPTV